MSTPTPNLATISPCFIVDDLLASTAYYVAKLGFVVDFQFKERGATFVKELSAPRFRYGNSGTTL